MSTRLQFTLTIFMLLFGFTSLGQKSKRNDYLLSFIDTTMDKYGYKNKNGDTVIQLSKYRFCFTDTFRTYAIVAYKNFGFVAIDRQKNILYTVFPIDN